MWIEWLSVVDIEFMCQKSYVWICCVFVKNGEWWTWNEFSWLIIVVDVWKTCVDELVCWLCHWWFGDESCCCCEIIMKFW